MFEFALRPSNRFGRAPDAHLLAAIAAAHGLDPALLPEMTLERNMLRELPGDRTIERIEVRRQRTVLARAVAKSAIKGQGERLFNALGSASLPIPRLLAYLPAHRVLLMAEARGERLDRLILAGKGESTAWRAGTAVATFHRHRPKELERITLERLIGDLHPSPAELPGPLGEDAAAIAARLLDSPDPAYRLAVLVHRDLHPRQIIDDGERATLIDLDLAGLGHPALDLANFEVYLRVRLPRRSRSLYTAFRQAYAATAGDSDLDTERIYRAFTYLRLAVKTYRTAPLHWRELAASLTAEGLKELVEPGLTEASR